MRISITSATTVGESRGGGSVDRSAIAVGEALTAGGIDVDDVDLLINTGIHRDDNIVEPAIAALIQKKSDINPLYEGQAQPALSFDLMNGPCGFLDAIEVTSAIFRTGGRRLAVIVGGEGHPSGSAREDSTFPYLTSAAAVVVAPATDKTGFGRVYRARTTAPDLPVGYLPLTTMGAQGCRVIGFERPDEQAYDRGLDVAVEAVTACLEREGLDPARCVLLASEPRPGFAKSVASAVGVDRVVTPDAPADPHSAALPFAYQAWLHADTPRGDAAHALFLGADGYFVAACAAYRLP
ncbi:hypothetical protein [Nocardia sp. NPDC058666]|uniref:hypothetical protein n=1 Tax=Nocardia sp. NPDC058666 TaxID=3346587 RepID=UPI00365E8332